MPVSTTGVTSFQQQQHHQQDSEGPEEVEIAATGSELSAPPRAKRCKHCDESNHRSDPGSGYWHLQLDQDLIDTISSIYPEWFIKDNNNKTMTEGGGSGGSGGGNGKGRPSLPPQVSSSSSLTPFSTSSSSSSSSSGASSGTTRYSPPKAIIDTSPILIDQNKESLKVKLLLRRPFDQLVAQGIMPPQGQRKSLDRAKTGDILKAKIQQRPPRQELERRHILEADALHADPSLAERQRMLRKARLADQLNDQLSHRPGPLELIQKNILHTEEPIEQAVKTGKIPYKATSEGALKRPQHPQNYINPEEDSQGSSEGDSQSQIISSSSPPPPPPPPLPIPHSTVTTATVRDVLETAAKSAGIMVSLIQPSTAVLLKTATLHKDNSSNSSCSSTSSTGNDLLFTDLCRSVANAAAGGSGTLLSSQCSGVATASSPAASLISSTSTLSPLSSVASPIPTIVTTSQPATPAATAPPPPPPPLPPLCTNTKLIHSGKSDAPGKDKNRKKSKSKAAPKTRTIKFHEYKGPPSAQKSSNNNNSNSLANGNGGETRYDLLLQQQTLLMQLELQHKYPQIILPAQQKPNATNTSNNNSGPSNINAGILNQNHNNNNNNGNSMNNIINRNIQPISSNNESASMASNGSIASKIAGRLEDMKVSDLKMELKRRNLPVSGSKPQLIERLKPFTIINQQQQQQQQQQQSSSTSDSIINTNPASVESVISTNSSVQLDQSSSQDIDSAQEFMDIASPATPAVVVALSSTPTTATALIIPSQHQDQRISSNNNNNNNNGNNSVGGVAENNITKTNEDIVREQQRQIEELQRELTLSQMKLQALGESNPARNTASNNGSSNNASPTGNGGTVVGKPEPVMLNAQLMLQKHLQAKQQQQQAQNLAIQMEQLRALQAKQSQVNVEQQRLQQQQHVAFQNQKNLNNGNGSGGGGMESLISALSDGVQKNLRNSNDVTTANVNVPPLVYQIMQEQHQQQPQPPNVLSGGHKAGPYITSTLIGGNPATNTQDIKINLNGLYQDDMKLLANANHIKKHTGKSQIVDDLLEILIKNGDLPPSAASYPSTPGSAEVKHQQQEPFYPAVGINRQPIDDDDHASQEMLMMIDANSPDPMALAGIDPAELLDTMGDLQEYMDINQLIDFNENGQNSYGNAIEMDDNQPDEDISMDTEDLLEAFMTPNVINTNHHHHQEEQQQQQHHHHHHQHHNYNTSNNHDTPMIFTATVSSNHHQDNHHDNTSTLNFDPLLGSSTQDNDDDDTFDLLDDTFNLDVFRSPPDITSASTSWDVV